MKVTDALRNTRLAVTLIRSTIGRPESQGKIVQILGLRKMHQTRIHQDGPRVWGLIEKVIHLVKIERIRVEDVDDFRKSLRMETALQSNCRARPLEPTSQ